MANTGYAQQREIKSGEIAKPAPDGPASAGPAAAKSTSAKRTPAKPAAARPAAKPPAALPDTYQVVKGDNLHRIAGKIRHPGVTLPQMALGLYRANPEAFVDGRIDRLIEGRVLKVPERDAVVAVGAAQAALEYKALIAKPAAPVPLPPPEVKEPVAKPPVEPPPPPKPAPPRAPAPALTPEQADQRYREAAAAERSGDLRAALQAYLEAGESGHGAAQKKLGDIYNAGNAVVTRDYETALRWYQKARAQGIEIPKPHSYPATRP